MQTLYAALKADDEALAKKISEKLHKDMEQQAAYYQSLPDSRRDALSDEESRNSNLMNSLNGLEQQFKMMKEASKAPDQVKQKATTDSAKP